MEWSFSTKGSADSTENIFGELDYTAQDGPNTWSYPSNEEDVMALDQVDVDLSNYLPPESPLWLQLQSSSPLLKQQQLAPSPSLAQVESQTSPQQKQQPLGPTTTATQNYLEYTQTAGANNVEVSQASRQVLVDIYNCVAIAEQKLIELRNLQSQLTLADSRVPNIRLLQSETKVLLEKSWLAIEQELDNRLVLTQHERSTVDQLRDRIRLQWNQLKLFDAELSAIESGNVSGVHFVSLVVYRQPFPQTCVKKADVMGTVEVRLLQGATVLSATPASKVMAQVVSTANVQIPMKNDQQDLVENVALFSKLKFKEGGRQALSRLQFSMSVNVQTKFNAMKQQQIVSELTEPFIVMVHALNQWMESEKMLLLHEAYFRITGTPEVNLHEKLSEEERKKLESEMAVRAPKFFNALMRRLSSITHSTERPLSINEILHLHAQCHNATEFSKASIDEFWDWFGKSFYLLRDPRKNLPMWLAG